MAHMRYKNKEGRVTELDIEIYSEGKELVSPDYSVNNGLITQNMTADLTIGQRRLTFPIAFIQINNGVFLEGVPDEIKAKVYISNTDLIGFTLHVLPHPLDPNTIIRITTTGY